MAHERTRSHHEQNESGHREQGAGLAGSLARRMTSVRPILLTLASGLLYGLAFPPHRITAVAWLALTPLLLALRETSWRGALGLGWLWSMLAAWSVGEWMPAAVETYYLQSRAIGYGVFVVVATLMVAPYHIGFALAYRGLARRWRCALPLLAAAAWTGAELLRGRLFTGTPFFIGNPWALLGYSQAGVLPILQVADLAGVYGVSFPIAALNAGLVEAWLAIRGRGLPRRSLAVALGAAALPSLLALGYGIHALSGTAQAEPAGPTARVAVIQGNVDVGAFWSPERYGQNLGLYLELTREAQSRAQPDIVVWPESAATFFLEEEPGYRLQIARALTESGAELLLGAPRAAANGRPPYFNSVYLLAPNGRVSARYDKQLLVPFAEYFPFGGIEFLRRRFGRVREFTAGPANAALPTGVGPTGVLICNEAMLPEVASQRVEVGATWLVSPSNDTWVPSADFAELQFDIVALRAIEQRRFLLRASTSGPSAIVDPFGRIRARSQPFTPAVVEGEIRALDGRTLYSRVGDLFAVGCLAVAMLSLASRASRSDRRHAQG